jgi:hypothetical protein
MKECSSAMQKSYVAAEFIAPDKRWAYDTQRSSRDLS